MNKFLYVATVVLCLGLANAEGESDPMGDAMKMLQSMDPATMCPQAAAMSCQSQAAVCIDIPDLMDCSKFPAMCQASAKSLCDCLAGCGPKCAAKSDCAGKTGPEEIECNAMVSTCKSQCETACPMEAMNAGLQMTLENMNKMVTGMTGMIQGLLKGEAPAAA